MRSLSMESRSADHHLKDESSVNTEMTANIKPGSFIVSEQKKTKKKKEIDKKKSTELRVDSSLRAPFLLVRSDGGWRNGTEEKRPTRRRK